MRTLNVRVVQHPEGQRAMLYLTKGRTLFGPVWYEVMAADLREERQYQVRYTGPGAADLAFTDYLRVCMDYDRIGYVEVKAPKPTT